MEKKVYSGCQFNIRLARPCDVQDVYGLVDLNDLDNVFQMEFKIHRDTLKKNLRDLVYLDGVVFVEYLDKIIGGIAGYCLPCFFTDEKMFCTCFLYIKPEFRRFTKAILKEFEMSVLPTPIKKITYGIPFNDRSEQLVRFFNINGYKTLETHVMKRL